MTKFVFVAVLAVLAFALYSIPSQSAEKGEGAAPADSAKPAQNSNGQIQNSKPNRERTAQRKSGERTKTTVPPVEQPKAEPAK